MVLARSRWPGLVLLFTALAVVPAPAAAFSGPKTWLLAGAAVLSLVVALVSRRRAEALAPALICAAASAASALTGDAVLPQAALLQLTAAMLLVAWTVTGVDVERTLPVVVGAGAVVALVAALQALGVDALGALGPSVTGERLRVYGTLGNPDFVAALLVPTLVLAVGLVRDEARRRARWLLGAAVVLHVAALLATRSFGTVVALVAAAGAWALCSRRVRSHRAESRCVLPPGPTSPAGASGAALDTAERRSRGLNGGGTALLVVAGLLVAVTLGGRDVGRAAEGRLYLWKVALPHLAEAPLFGLGPGAVEARFAGWEAQAWASHALGDESRRFIGAQNHLHNDLLERALEQGVVGLVAFLALVAIAFRRLMKTPPRHAAALAAALAALLARALVDFPLARPAELCLFVLLIAAALSPRTLEET